MIAALSVELSCRIDGAPLREVNPGRSDGAHACWVGACTCCGRHWAVVADMAQLLSRGPNERHP